MDNQENLKERAEIINNIMRTKVMPLTHELCNAVQGTDISFVCIVQYSPIKCQVASIKGGDTDALALRLWNQLKELIPNLSENIEQFENGDELAFLKAKGFGKEFTF